MVTIDPQNLIGNAVSNLVKTSIILGLPSPIAPVPNFVLATINTESAQGSVTLPGLQLTAGDYLMKVAINPGTYSFTLILSDYDPLPAPWLTAMTTALQQLSNLANQAANFGSVLPNLSSVSANHVSSQLAVLYSMKNNAQPILILNSYITLGSLSQTNPYLQSNWYIEMINPAREEAEGGLVVDITVKELLTKRDASLTTKNIISNIAGVVTGGVSKAIF